MRCPGSTRGRRGRVAIWAVVALIASVAAIPQAGAAAPTPTVVLDPDDNYAFAVHDGVRYTELPITHDIARSVQAQLPTVCAANIVITRNASPNFVDRSARASQMQTADLAVTLSLNSNAGVPFGTPATGGSSAFATTAPNNLAFATELTNQMGAFTGRPTTPVNQEQTGGRVYPYPEFAALPGTYAQLFMMFIDHTFDFDVIQNGRDLMVNAVVTALANKLQAQGFQCLGSFPTLPTAARLQQLRNLGYQRFLRYNAEPVSMSTGNFSTAEEIFKLPGVGNQEVDLTLNYNAQSGQDSPVGAGWQFVYGAFLQQYSDGSVVVNLPDGRALQYVSNGAGGFTTPAGAFAVLTQLDASTFKWMTTTGTSMTFAQDAAGRGRLTSTTDRQGNTETLTYDGTGTLFPRLTGIADQAGQAAGVATNGEGRITSFTRPDGGVWRLAYSPTGDLTSVTSARGTVRRFNYDDQHRMVSQVGQDGVTFLTNVYDSQSRVVRQANAFGQLRSLVFDDANRTTTYTDTTGAVTVYHWNALGQVTRIVDALGGVTQTGYSPQLLPLSETDELNRTTAMTYDPSGQVASMTDPLGNVASSTYNSTGDMTSRADAGGTNGSARTIGYALSGDGMPTTITNPDGTTQQRTYNAAGDVTATTDEAGAVTGYAYDGRGNTISVTDPLGRVTTMTYDLANRLTGVTDPLGRTTSYAYDANDNLTRITYPNAATELRSYDLNDQLISSTDRRGAVTTYTRDLELNLTQVKLPNGGVVTRTFDSENRLTSMADPLGNTTRYRLDALGRRVVTTDPRGNATTVSYDVAGQVTAETDPSGATTSFARDANGRVITVTDPAGGTTSSEWDQVGRQKSRTDQLGHRTSMTYNFRDQVTSAIDPAGGVGTNAYDPVGRLIKQTDAAGAVTSFNYDAAGQLVKITDALGGVTTFAYDAAGNRISTTDANGHVTKISYNAMNEPVSQTDGNGQTWTLVRDAGGLVTDEADPLGHHTLRAYDSIGNLTSTTDASGRITRFGFDLSQRPISQTAPDGVVTANEFDAASNLVGIIRNARGGEPKTSTVNVTTRYAYDGRNLLISTTDANSAVSGFEYDERGQLVRSTSPIGKVTTYAYDAAGNRSRRTDANGVATNYRYDPRGLLVQQAYPDGTTETFSYDQVGRQLTAANIAGTVATSYDLLARPTKVTDAAGKTLSYAYDAVGNRTGLTLPDGRTLSYTYDAADQLTKLVSPLGDMTMQYDAAGRPTVANRPNGTTISSGFNDTDELTQLVTKAGSTTLASFVYAYDNVGNVASREQNVGGTNTTTKYSYDPLRRLTKDAGGPLASTYGYDAVGNRLTWSAPDDPATPKPNDSFVQTNTFNGAGQLVTSAKARENGGKTFTDITTNTYDANGNRIFSDTVAQAPGQSAGTAYDYDFENRLVGSGPAGDRSQRGNGVGQRDYARSHDALGRLVTETRAKTTTTWTADGLNPIVAADSSSTFYLRDGAGQLQGEVADAADPAWYITDALGSILGSTTTKAKVAGKTAFGDYGVNLGADDFRMGFGGELADPLKAGNGIGNDSPRLNHYYARSYEPSTGTWLQPDPIRGDIRRPETLAAYQFVGGNPSSRTDLLGFLSVGVATTQYNVSVGVSNGSWNGGSLQGSSESAQALQPTFSPQTTVDSSYLQNTVDSSYLFSGYGWRSPASYGQMAAFTMSSSIGSELQFGAGGSFARQFLDAVDFGVGVGEAAASGFYRYAVHNVAGHYRAGTWIASHPSYNRGVGQTYGNSARTLGSFNSGLKWTGRGLTVVQVGLGGYDAFVQSAGLPGSERAAATYLGGADSAVEAAAGWGGAKAGAFLLGGACAASGVGTIGTPACALVGGVAGYAGSTVAYREVRDVVVPAYQEGVSNSLDCWPNCSNWQLTGGPVVSGVKNVWNSIVN